ncbi:hypothetical protein MP638_006390, partial [Amoeboaphelidium occidentale]
CSIWFSWLLQRCNWCLHNCSCLDRICFRSLL